MQPRNDLYPSPGNGDSRSEGETASASSQGARTGLKRPNSKPRPWEQIEDGEVTSFGNWLRRQRELREITLREIADSSKISLRYLEALEEERFDVLPAPVFAKGFLRQYAKYVGLNPDEVVNHYLWARQAKEPPQEEEPEEREYRPAVWRQALLVTLGILLLIALVAFLAFQVERRRGRTGEAMPPPMAAPVVESPPPVEPILQSPGAEEEAPVRVTLDFRQQCWVEAVVDGTRQLAEIRVQGESVQLDAQESVVLKLGNAAGVEVSVNGEPLDLGARRGEVRTLRIDRETVEALTDGKGNSGTAGPVAR